MKYCDNDTIPRDRLVKYNLSFLNCGKKMYGVLRNFEMNRFVMIYAEASAPKYTQASNSG